MNANELADRLDLINEQQNLQIQAATMLRQLQAENEVLKADNGHYRDMAVDFLRCKEPYGWHCFTEDDDCLIMNVYGSSKPDNSWKTVIPLYLHSPRQAQEK